MEGVNDLSQEEIEEYEQQLAELSEKDLLIHQLVELQRIRYTLEMLAVGGQPTPLESPETDDGGGNPVYECVRCGDVVPESDRAEHAKAEHGWIDGLTNIDDEFDKV